MSSKTKALPRKPAPGKRVDTEKPRWVCERGVWCYRPGLIFVRASVHRDGKRWRVETSWFRLRGFASVGDAKRAAEYLWRDFPAGWEPGMVCCPRCRRRAHIKTTVTRRVTWPRASKAASAPPKRAVEKLSGKKGASR